MEALQRIPMSWEEYLATPEHPRHEWVDGMAVVSPDPVWRHERVARKLANLFDAVDGLYGSSGGNVKLPENRVRIPDALATTQPEGLFIEQPVLVVEVLSPSTRSEDLVRKPPEYAAAGIEQYWIVDPAQRSLEVKQLVDGRWVGLARFDDLTPVGEVAIGDHGVVVVNLLDLLDG
ncbi:Uma2 family endonuclease [Nocardioides stalactiti]|uniref:Uma2 family endonuclease n=1 Tax=Nocardioides stalactiti TaxID=2755356 RepID=UPI0016037318|nr:Uma2 family endonuclease [Nocardioides stalactiti]